MTEETRPRESGCFFCTGCGRWCISIEDIDGSPHRIKKALTPADLEKELAVGDFPKEEHESLRTLARRGKLTYTYVCGNYQRATLEMMIEAIERR